VAAAAGLALVAYLAAHSMSGRRRAGDARTESASVETTPPSMEPSPPQRPATEVPPASAPAVADPAVANTPDAPLTPAGAARALRAIGKNEQTRLLFARLMAGGLSREQQQRVVLILGAEALRPPAESPTFVTLQADGHSRVLSAQDGKRVLDERKRAQDQSQRALGPALAAVLTPAQLAAAGLGDGAKPR
jgi:hypothetical protein